MGTAAEPRGPCRARVGMCRVSSFLRFRVTPGRRSGFGSIRVLLQLHLPVGRALRRSSCFASAGNGSPLGSHELTSKSLSLGKPAVWCRLSATRATGSTASWPRGAEPITSPGSSGPGTRRWLPSRRSATPSSPVRSVSAWPRPGREPSTCSTACMQRQDRALRATMVGGIGPASRQSAGPGMIVIRRSLPVAGTGSRRGDLASRRPPLYAGRDRRIPDRSGSSRH